MRGFAFLTVLSLTPLARAEPPPSGPVGLQAGAGFEILPLGELSFAVDGDSTTADTATAFGLTPFLDYAPVPFFSVGLAPRFLLNVKGKEGDASAKQLDLRVRAMVRLPVARTVRLFGYAAPGYSIIFPPDWPDGVSRPKGFILAFAGGAAFDFSPQGFVSFEIGYQLGWQSLTESGIDFDLSDNYLHLGAAVGARL